MDCTLLPERSIVVGAVFADKALAIRACGEMLAKAGHVEPGYIDAMLERDRLSTTYIGNGVAIPHGTRDSRRFVKSTGLALIQVPGGVDFGNGNVARLLVALAAKGEEHLDLLSEIAMICADDEQLSRLLLARTSSAILDVIAPDRKV